MYPKVFKKKKRRVCRGVRISDYNKLQKASLTLGCYASVKYDRNHDHVCIF